MEGEGCVTGWDSNGKLVWTNTLKSKGRFISWIDNMLVLSFETGETLWLDRDSFTYTEQRCLKRHGLYPQYETNLNF